MARKTKAASGTKSKRIIDTGLEAPVKANRSGRVYPGRDTLEAAVPSGVTKE